MQEYHRLLHMKTSPKEDTNCLQRELYQRMNEKDQQIMNLQKEIKSLTEEKFKLMCQLETTKSRGDSEMELKVRSRCRFLIPSCLLKIL